MKAERGLQLRFILWPVLGCLLLLAGIPWIYSQIALLPNREDGGRRSATIHLRSVELRRGGLGELRIAGAWDMTSSDSRFGGISALAIDGPWFLALTDSGGIVRFPRSGGETRPATIFDLPAGPASGLRKSHRDSEVLLRDPADGGWLVAFENQDQLWLYDRAFTRGSLLADLRKLRLPTNAGIEGAASDGDAVLLFPESGGSALRVRSDSTQRVKIAGSTARISDAATLPDGSILILERQPTPRGFRNSLAWLERDGRDYRVIRRAALPLGPFDNAEALAVEPRPSGLRLWLMTDDGFRGPFRTLLLALDVPVQGRGR